MPENEDKKFLHGMAIALASAIIGALLTIIGQPYVNKIFEEKKTPKLIKEQNRTNIAELPDNVRNQITLITTRYSLRHLGGGAAEQITVTINSSEEIPTSNIIVSGSEQYRIDKVNANVKKIEVPVIRPNGAITFELTHSPKNKIDISEIAKTGEILDSPLGKTTASSQWIEYFVLALFLIFWASFIFAAYKALLKAARFFISLDSNPKQGLSEKGKNRLASMLVILLTYNVLAKLYIGNLSLPHIPISDVFYLFLLYILVINYHKLITLLNKATE